MLINQEKEKIMQILKKSKSKEEAYSTLLAHYSDIDFFEVKMMVRRFVDKNYKPNLPKETTTELVEDRLTGTLYELKVDKEDWHMLKNIIILIVFLIMAMEMNH